MDWDDPVEREDFHAQIAARIPSWYSPMAHLCFPSLFGLATIVTMALLLRDVTALQLLTVPLVLLVSNAFEWRVHRDVLHRRFPFFETLYERHTPEHHRAFTTHHMAIRSRREFRLVLIPAWGICGIVLLDLPVAAAFWWLGQRNVACLFVATSVFYVVSYELLHLAYHLPESHPIGRLDLIRRLRRHHAVHHSPRLMQKWNFNVTVPLWDLVRGTIFRGPVPGE